MKQIPFFTKTVIFFFSFVLTVFSAMSQDLLKDEIRWIEKLKVPSVQNIDVMKMDSNVLIYQSNKLRNQEMFGGSIIGGGESNHVYRVELNSKKTIDKNILLKTGEKRRAVEKILYLNNMIHVISSFINEEQKKYYVFDETLSSESLELNNDVKKISEVDFGKMEDVNKSAMVTSVTLSRGKLMVSSTILSKKENVCCVSIFDTQFREKAHYTIKTANSSASLERIINDNEDNLYAIEGNIAKKNEQRKYIVYFYPKDNSTPKQQAFVLENKVISFQLAINNKNELVCAGLFYKNGQMSARGAFSYVCPAHLSTEGRLNLLPFSGEFLTSGLEADDAAKVERALNNNEEFNDKCYYLLDTLHVQQNGDFMFTTEKYKILRQSSTTYNASTGSFTSSNETFYYTFGDIYVLSCNVDGSFKWNQKINRDAILKNEDSNAGHYLTYFDDNSNLNLIYGSFLSTSFFGNRSGFGKDPKTVMTTFDSKGNKTERVLFTDKKTVKGFVPSYSKSCGNGNLIVTRIKDGIIATTSTYSVAQISLK